MREKVQVMCLNHIAPETACFHAYIHTQLCQCRYESYPQAAEHLQPVFVKEKWLVRANVQVMCLVAVVGDSA